MGSLFIERGRKPGLLVSAFNYLLVVASLIAFFWLSLSRIEYALDFTIIGDYTKRLGDGFLLTIKLSAASLALSLVIGILGALGYSSKILPLRYLCRIYVTFIRGTPLITQIYLFYYIVSTAWGINSKFLAGVIILSIFEGAYISEIIRGSLLSLSASQLEAARAVGFTRRQTARYVILPQLIARTLPALTGQFASLIKDSSLLSVVAVIEITQTVREITSINFRLFEFYIALAGLYILLTLPISLLSQRFERKFKYEN